MEDVLKFEHIAGFRIGNDTENIKVRIETPYHRIIDTATGEFLEQRDLPDRDSAIDQLYKIYKQCYTADLNETMLHDRAFNESDHNAMCDFIQARINEGHTSGLDNISFTFHFSNVSRAMTHQLVRHRIAAYMQSSQRYVDFTKNDNIPCFNIANKVCNKCYRSCEFRFRVSRYLDSIMTTFHSTVPWSEEQKTSSAIRAKTLIEAAKQQLIDMHELLPISPCLVLAQHFCDVVATYNTLRLKYSLDPEDARCVFPQAMTSELFTTMNLTSLHNLITKRTCVRAQAEIRHTVNQLRELLIPYVPFVSTWGPACYDQKYCIEHNGCGLYPKKKETVIVKKSLFEQLTKAQDVSASVKSD